MRNWLTNQGQGALIVLGHLANSVLSWHILGGGGSKELVGFMKLFWQIECDLSLGRSGERVVISEGASSVLHSRHQLTPMFPRHRIPPLVFIPHVTDRPLSSFSFHSATSPHIFNSCLVVLAGKGQAWLLLLGSQKEVLGQGHKSKESSQVLFAPDLPGDGALSIQLLALGGISSIPSITVPSL